MNKIIISILKNILIEQHILDFRIFGVKHDFWVPVQLYATHHASALHQRTKYYMLD